MEDELKERQKIALFLALIVIISCFILIFGLYWMKSRSVMANKTWDIRNVTASDFTIEVSIPRPAYYEFK